MGCPRARIALAAACLAALAFPSAARADDEEELAGLLNENVVSGPSKIAELASDAPATTTTITAADIHRYGIRSLDEAINFLGMGFITQNPLHSVDIGGRGVLLTADFGNHVLLVVDGHTMNEPWDGTAYFEQGAAIPMELIDHIELVLGPGSVLYGGNAMIGVVNVVTKRASSFGGVHVVAEGSASPGQGKGGSFTSLALPNLGASYRLGVGVGEAFTLLGKPAEFTGQVELYAQKGPSFEWGPQTSTNADGTPTNFGPRTPLGVWGGVTTRQYATSVPAIMGRLAIGDLSIWVRAAEYQRSTPYINGFNQNVSDFDEPRSYERDGWASIDIQYQTHLARAHVLDTHAYADAYEYDQPLYTSDGSLCAGSVTGACVQTALGRSQWFGAEAKAKYDWTGDDRLTTMLGLDGRLRRVGGETDTTVVATGSDLPPIGRRFLFEPVWASYLQQRYSPLAILHLNGGIRFDADPRGGNRFSPRLAAVLDVWPGGVVKAIYSEAFRAPTFYEAYYQSPQQQPEPNIRSEVVRGAESSLEQRVGSHRFLMGVFATRWTDMISLEVAASGQYQYQNVSSIDSYGYNARAEGTFGELRYGLSVTGAHSRRNTPDGAQPLAASPQIYGNVRLSSDLPGELPVLALATTFVGPTPADRAFDGNFATTPYAPASVELRGTLSGRVPALSAMSYRVGATFVTASQSPYVAGPTQFVDPNTPIRPDAELAPVNRFTTFGTLQYDFP